MEKYKQMKNMNYTTDEKNVKGVGFIVSPKNISIKCIICMYVCTYI